jgi:ankyrin repeat protein
MAQDRLDSLLFEVVNQEQEYENVEQVKRLFDLGARVTVLPSGVTVLHAAALNGHSKVLQYLCQAGTNPNIPHKRSDELNGSTPAHYAAMNCHQAAIEELRQHGADLMLKNGTGKTPIDYWKQCAKN